MTESHGSIDRRALISRHNPVVRAPDPYAPLSVGNGEFAFTVDVTGLQSYPAFYTSGVPLGTQSQWGWHAFPNPESYGLDDAQRSYDSHGRPVPYPSAARSSAGQWLRASPHRLDLARIGFQFGDPGGARVEIGDLCAIRQELELWSGTLYSVYEVDGMPIQVWTWCHPAQDAIAVRAESPLITAGRLRIRVAFPYGSSRFGGEAADWETPDAHRTAIVALDERHVTLTRTLDDDGYHVRLAWADGCAFRETARHVYDLVPRGDAGSLECTIAFAAGPIDDPFLDVASTREACRAHWARFWSTGGAVDLSGSTDPRAYELERRIVLSQYLTAIQCAGSMPPQETGLTHNSWFGKAHLEMHWWHAVHFALWGRPALLERSLPWYDAVLPAARETAARQGYAGARWPKMVGPQGRESPSPIGPFLIWQQPHPIYYAELCYRAHPDRVTLERYREIVAETASFMASYAWWDAEGRRYVLGPPLIPAQESHPPTTTFNPTFELAYWAFGLETAQRWRERLSLARDPEWDRVLSHLSALPTRDGLYVNAESAPTTFSDPDQRRDHPSLLAAYGLLPGGTADRETMRRTLRRVLETWCWETTWGWDYPTVAMTAARLDEPELAVDALLMDAVKNRYLPNGHNYQRPNLTIYLPGNGGLLAAIAMMAAGWEGAPDEHAPGFPQEGWSVRWEGLVRMP
jgi:hypothetical protein